MPTTEKPGLTRDAIKYLAIFTMLLNHIANVLLPENTILWEVFIDIGYFTAITMCYFLVEGFYYTHSRRKYGERLLIFAGISQVPYMIAFGNSQLNMIFTLFICFMILVVQERMMASKWRIPLLILLLLLSVCSDWAILAPVFTIWFHESWGNRKRMITAYGVGAALFVLFNHSCLTVFGSRDQLLLYNGKNGSRTGNDPCSVFGSRDRSIRNHHPVLL